jgi:TetR/AcrR family transcriptional regulator, tetracycline repressor protein
MPRPRGRPVAVDRATLITTTLSIIDSDGIDAVTMRRIAAELGVSPMAAYRHTSSKDELLRIVAASVVADLPRSPAGTPWPDVVQAFFEAFHDRLREHPGVAALFGGQAFLSETVYAVSEHVFAALLEAGFTPATAVSLFMACASCSIGAALLESAEAHHTEAGRDAMVLLLSATKYPAIAAVAAHLPGRQSPESHTEALRNLIAGYRATLG